MGTDQFQTSRCRACGADIDLGQHYCGGDHCARARQDVMTTAHRSWEAKGQIEQRIVAGVVDLAANIYTEYSTFRQASARAAYDIAQERLHEFLQQIEREVLNELAMTHAKEINRA